MEKQPQIRCQYTQEGLDTFGHQRIGYAVPSRNGYSYRVKWDKNKTWQTYAKSFIDVSPIIALYSDEDVDKINNPEVEVSPKMIDSIEKNLNTIEKMGLTRKALVVLLHSAIGTGKISKKQIEYVLEELPRVREKFIV